jgi:phage terminase large subunit GpA-like protein
MSFVDEGGHFTQQVRRQCRNRIRRKVFCIKGMAGPDKPYTAPPKTMKIMDGQQAVVGTCWQYQLGVDAGKQIIMDDLRVETPGPRYCHFPKRDDYGPGYFAGLLSERLVYEANKRQPWSWKKIPGHERNEALDCRNYAMAAFEALTVNLDQVDRRLKEGRGQKVTAATPTAAQTEGRTGQKSSKRKVGLDKFYDSW